MMDAPVLQLLEHFNQVLGALDADEVVVIKYGGVFGEHALHVVGNALEHGIDRRRRGGVVQRGILEFAQVDMGFLKPL